MTIMKNKFSLSLFLFLCATSSLHPVYSQISTCFTYSRSQGLSTNSSSSSVTLSASRVLDPSCKAQVQKIYKQQGYTNWQDQGCVTQPENVIALPSRKGQLDEFQIIDETRQFSVADRSVSSISESIKNQKSMTGFTGFGYSVFTMPQN